MAEARVTAAPKNFFLNERHELSAVEKGGGGRFQEYVDVPWAQKAKKISTSIRKVIADAQKSVDPLKNDHYFVLAKPQENLHKKSQSKKNADRGFVDESPDFGRQHHRVFGKLGLDLVTVTSTGEAIVHAKAQKLEALMDRAKDLDSLGTREQAQWAVIDLFEAVPVGLRADEEWLNSLSEEKKNDFVIELQPLLGRVDADRVVRSVAELIRGRAGRVTGSGTDYSGRYWYRAEGLATSVRDVVRDFFSIQSVHSPLYSVAAYPRKARQRQTLSAVRESRPIADTSDLPTVAVVDLGVPADHDRLSPYLRGRLVGPDAVAQAVGDHGSRVAARVVFGDCDSMEQLLTRDGELRFYDVIVADGTDDTRVYDKSVVEASRLVQSVAPDVRVYNFSFGDRLPLGALDEVERREKLTQVQDLDNFIFAHDVAVIVAAGNSQPGVLPSTPYPDHHADPEWALGAWASGYNTWVCGAYVGRLTTDGLVRNLGWPSPFCRVGPGPMKAPIPSFSANGGNCAATYRGAAGLGVWTLSAAGYAEDQMGTSFAAPLIAREAALCLAALRRYCAPGTKPFAVTARAFLALTAVRPVADHRAKLLVEHTLGYGLADSRRLERPIPGSATILWQGTIESPKDKVRVQLPIPKGWLEEAARPELRLLVAYDPPVNLAAQGLWACRKVNCVLKPGPDKKGLMRASSVGSHSYSMIDRTYNLGKYLENSDDHDRDDLWVLELSYDEIFETIPQMVFDPRQRVALAAELVDRGENPTDPQPFVQSLPASASMTRFSAPAAVSNPVLVRRRMT